MALHHAKVAHSQIGAFCIPADPVSRELEASSDLLAESTVNIRARWWIKPPRRAPALDLQDNVLTAIKNKLTANGIDLPFPTQQILFHDQTEETDSDRSRQREGWPAGRGKVPRPRNLEDSLRKLVEVQTQQNGGQSRSSSNI